MPLLLLVNIAVMLVLMVLIPTSWPEPFPVRPWVAILVLAVVAILATLFGARRRRRGWSTDPTRNHV